MESRGASASPPQEVPFLIGLFLVTAATLALEVLVTRLLSVLTWYSLAFLVIGMGMFGLTAGAVRVYLDAERYRPERLGASLARASVAFAGAIPVMYILLLVVPLRMAPEWTTVALFLLFAAIIALPFVAAGMVVAGAVTKAPFPTGKVYAVDLAGAAIGAPLVPELLERVDCGTAILLMGCLAAAGGWSFARSVEDRGGERRALAVGGVLLVVCLFNAGNLHGLVPLWAKGQPEDRSQIEFEAWNSHSRVQVSPVKIGPATLWGGGSRCRVPQIKQRLIMIDADAATPLYQPEHGLEDLRFLDCDVTNIAHHLRSGGPMAIIGVGGSRDIQAALLFEHAPVVGIELNRRLLEILKGPMGQPTGVPSHPDVRLVHDEARSYLTRSQQSFRIIQASLIDTWAATGAGAHALGENGLYTREAWMTFLDRLEPGGVLTMSRWSSGETIRMVALGVDVLLSRGVTEPRSHFALVQSGKVTTLVLGRDPLTEEDGKTLQRVAEERGFRILLSPTMPRGKSKLEAVLDAKTHEELDAATLFEDVDYRPTTDDKPFFFNVVRLSAFANITAASQGSTIEGNRLATMTLVLSLFASVALALAAIVGPLVNRAKPTGRTTSTLYAGLCYFGLIGIGFMFCEVALLQRLSLVLGHPSYSLIVVLASLVAAAGLGSLLSDKLPLDRAPYCYLYPALLAGLLLVTAFVLPALSPTVLPASTPMRILFSVAFTATLGLALGLAFPAGMRLWKAGHEDEGPWLWGVNGVGGVVASSAAVMIALSVGLRFLFIASALCYLLLLPAVAMLRRAARSLNRSHVEPLEVACRCGAARRDVLRRDAPYLSGAADVAVEPLGDSGAGARLDRDDGARPGA